MYLVFRKFIWQFSAVKNEYNFSNINSIMEYDGNNQNVSVLKQLLSEIKENYDVAFNNILKLNEEGTLCEYMSLMERVFYLRYIENSSSPELANIFDKGNSALGRYENFTTIMPVEVALKVKNIYINPIFLRL